MDINEQQCHSDHNENEDETNDSDQGRGGHKDESLEEADGQLAEAQAARGREDAGF